MITKFPKLTAAQKRTLTGAWSYEQAVLFTKEMFSVIGDAWGWMVPTVREAMVATEAFSIIRMQDRNSVEVADMDKLLLAMRVAAGLADAPEAK